MQQPQLKEAKKMIIQYASDLHLEFAENSRYIEEHPLEVRGDILLLAGDIGLLNHASYRDNPFWDYVSRQYRQVIVAIGNHELYNYYDLATIPNGLVYSIRDNVNCYYNAVLQIEHIELIVSTLWAMIPLREAAYTERNVGDFYRILYKELPLNYSEFNREHKRCLSFIKKAVANSQSKNIVVLSHHVPSFRLDSPDFATSRIKGAFTVELADFIEKSPIKYWIYGHSHRNIDKRIGNTLCLSNQLGYVELGEHKDFNPGKYFEI